MDTTLAATPAVERDLAGDMVRRALPAVPVVVLVAGLVRGGDGAWSAACAVAIILVNLVASAVLLSWAARRSLDLLMMAALGGFIVRMGVVALVLFAVHERSWVDLPVLGITLVASQLGLLFWETRYVSASLAFPGLKPPPPRGA